MGKFNSEPMIRFVPYNQCLECGGELVVIETETNILELDKKGSVISNENFALESKLICTKCGKQSDVNHVAMKYIEKSNVTPLKRKQKNSFGYTDKELIPRW